MSSGLFGGLFRRQQKEDEPESRPQPPGGQTPYGSGRTHGQAPVERKGSGEMTPGASPYLKYGLRGMPEPDSPGRPTEERRPAAPKAQDTPPSTGAEKAAAPAAAPSAQPPVGSPLDALTRDAVVMSLLQEGVVSMPQALVALRQQARQPELSLWRHLLSVQAIDRDAVLAEAARVQGFTTAHISAKKPTDDLVEAVRGLFPAGVGKEMFRLGLLPYEFMMDPATRQHRLVFATSDPSNPEVDAFVHMLGIEVELRYAPEAGIAERIESPAPAGAPAPVPKAAVAPSVPRTVEAPSPTVQSTAPVVPPVAAPKLPAPEPKKTEEPVAEAPAEPEPAPPKRDVPHPLPGGYSFEDVQRMLEADMRPGDDVLVDTVAGPSLPVDRIGDEQDGALDGPACPFRHTDNEEASFDGSAIDLPPEPPTVHVSGGGAPPEDDETPSVDSGGEAPAADINLEGIKARDRVVAMLLRKEIVTPHQVQDAQKRQEKEHSKEALWRLLAGAGGVDREAIYAEAARVYAFPAAKLGEGLPDPEFARSVVDTFNEERRDELLKLRVLPFECDLEQQTGAIKLVFITHDPTRPEVHRLMQKLKLERFELRYAPESIVHAAIVEAFPRKNEYLERISTEQSAYDLGTNYDEKAALIDEGALEAEISRSTLINLFEATLIEAVRQGASDIHIYPNNEKKIEIHFRIDGRLGLWHLEEKVHPEALLAVIKDNAINVDRFERDAAQDGFIQRWIDEVLIRFRVSVLPIANVSQELRSESIVIRVLDDRKVITDLKKLGLLKGALEKFDHAIRQPHGMVILTGPTGSGKSTTLVAALHQVVTPEVNVLTVEDPVEYIIPGVRQIKLNYKLGLEEALRAILRHDPDIVMVGEMRDRQTAELAIKLANTGHLTFSTLHTNDAPSAVSRLYKMGVEPFLIAYAINLIVAQRLIRKVCPACKVVDDDPDPVMLEKMGFSEEDISSLTFYKQGHNPQCKTCKGTGYKGRRAISEALYFSRSIRHLIVEADKQINEQEILDQAVKEGMLTLSDSAREVVRMGETTILEMLRVVTTDS